MTAAKKVTVLSELITDPNQQVHVTITSSKKGKGGAYACEGTLSDGTECKGEILIADDDGAKKGDVLTCGLNVDKKIVGHK